MNIIGLIDNSPWLNDWNELTRRFHLYNNTGQHKLRRYPATLPSEKYAVLAILGQEPTASLLDKPLSPGLLADSAAGRVTWFIDYSYESREWSWYGNDKLARFEDVLLAWAQPKDPQQIVWLTGCQDKPSPQARVKVVSVDNWAGIIGEEPDVDDWATDRLARIRAGQVQPSHKALVYNRRAREHRALMMAWLEDAGLLEQTVWSWGGVRPVMPTFEELSNTILDWDHRLALGSWQWMHRPANRDLVKNDQIGAVLREDIEATAFHIASETYYNPKPFPTEKSYRPMLNMQPFVIWGPAGSVAYMRSRGFHCFDRLIDHTYDTADNPAERWALLKREIARLYSLDWSALYPGLADDFAWNFQRWKDLAGTPQAGIIDENIY